MSRFVIHIHSGPEDANKVTLACVIARSSLNMGHDVTVFLAGDGVHLLAPEHVASVEGLGTGTLAEHVPALAENGARFAVSRLSAKSRGYDDTLIEGYPARFILPDEAVSLIDSADKVLCY